MRKLFSRFQQLDQQDARLTRKYKQKEIRNSYRTVTNPSSSLFFDIVFSKQLYEGESCTKIQTPYKANMQAYNNDVFQLSKLTKKLAVPSKKIGMRFFKHDKNFEKNLNIIDLQSFQTLVIEGGREVDYHFYVESQTFMLQDALSLFSTYPRFAVFILSHRNGFVELIGDTKASFEFDGYCAILTRVEKDPAFHNVDDVFFE